MFVDSRAWLTNLVRRYPTAPRRVALRDVILCEIRDPSFLGWLGAVVGLLAGAGLVAQWNHSAAPFVVFAMAMLALICAVVVVNDLLVTQRLARYSVLAVVEVLDVDFPARAPTIQTPARGQGPGYCVINWQVTLPTDTFYEGPIILVRGERILPWVDHPGARMEALVNLDPRNRGVYYGVRPLESGVIGSNGS